VSKRLQNIKDIENIKYV